MRVFSNSIRSKDFNLRFSHTLLIYLFDLCVSEVCFRGVKSIVMSFQQIAKDVYRCELPWNVAPLCVFMVREKYRWDEKRTVWILIDTVSLSLSLLEYLSFPLPHAISLSLSIHPHIYHTSIQLCRD